MTVRIDGTNSAANPAITGADADTGLHIGTNQVSLCAGGEEQLTVDDSGDVTIQASATPSINFSINPGEAFGSQSDADVRIQNDNGSLVITRAFDDGTAETLDVLSLSNQMHHHKGNSFRFQEATSPDNEAENNYFEVNPRANAADADQSVFKYVKTDEYDGDPVHLWDDQGRVFHRSGGYFGQARTDANSPSNNFPDANHHISLARGADGDTSAYQLRFLWSTPQTTDTGDISVFEYWNSVDGTAAETSNTSSSDIKACMKANGRSMYIGGVFVGRVENDAATPISVYGGSSSVNAYGDNSGGNTYIRGDNNPTTTNYAYYVDNDSVGGSSSNAYTGIKFKVRAIDGRIYQDYGSTFSNADYAEYFEWHDGNPDDEYRAGHSVVLVEGTDKIRIATTDDDPDDIIGIVSVAPGIVGDSYDLHWQGAYKKDQFGKEEWEPVQVYKWNPLQSDDQPTNEYQAKHCQESIAVDRLEEQIANGKIPAWVRDVAYEITDYKRVKSDDWDRSVEYTPREERPEWTPIGLVGKLWLKPNEPVGSRWKLLKTDADTGNKLWLVR